jgi:hypothetical protein
VHVAHRHALRDEHETGEFDRFVDRRPAHDRAAPHTPADGDQVLGLENAHRFAQGRARDAEAFEHLGFGQQQAAGFQLARHDLLAQFRGDKMRQFGKPNILREHPIEVVAGACFDFCRHIVLPFQR